MRSCLDQRGASVLAFLQRQHFAHVAPVQDSSSVSLTISRELPICIHEMDNRLQCDTLMACYSIQAMSVVLVWLILQLSQICTTWKVLLCDHAL